MNTHHTPGPWHVEPDQPSHGCALCIVDKEGIVIARTPTVPHYEHPEQAQDEANARLIAAAPELLDALQELLDQIQNGKPFTGSREDMERESVTTARAAIAKATQP